MHFLTCGSEEDVAEEDDSSLCPVFAEFTLNVSDREAAVFLDLDNI